MSGFSLCLRYFRAAYVIVCVRGWFCVWYEFAVIYFGGVCFIWDQWIAGEVRLRGGV